MYSGLISLIASYNQEHIIEGDLYAWLVTGIKPDGEIIWAKEKVAPVLVNSWQQYVLTVNNNSASVHINGKPVWSKKINWRPARDIKNLTIGGIDEMSRNYQNRLRTNNNFNGLIDEVRIYTEPLTQQEVLQLYNRGKP